jgi:hypothetical protein
MDAEISCRYRTARAVPLLLGAESRWQRSVANAMSIVLQEAEGAGSSPAVFTACKASSISLA